MMRRMLALILSLMLLMPLALSENLPSVQECIYTPGEKTVIRYTLPSLATISLSVFDGETEVASILKNRKMIAGNHALELDENFFGSDVHGHLTLTLTVDGTAYPVGEPEGGGGVPGPGDQGAADPRIGRSSRSWTLLAMLVGWRLIASWRPRTERAAAPDA